MSKLRSTTRMAVGIGIVVTVDLTTKLVAAAMAAGHDAGPLVPVRNHELSLGIAGPPTTTALLMAALGIVVAALFTVGPTRRGALAPWIPACLLGGSIANLVDRAAFGSVHDFLATPWVVFNLADVAVIAGLAGGIATWIRHHRHEEVIPCKPSANAR